MWKRDINNIFVLWTHNHYELVKFITHLNTINLTIKFTSEISGMESPVLDLMMYVRDVHLSTGLYTKPIDRP